MDFNNGEFLKKITSMGTLGYPLEKICNVLEIPAEHVDAFAAEFYQEGSAVNRAYTKGTDKSEYILDLKLFEQAKEGDPYAIQQFLDKRSKNEQQQKKDREKRKWLTSSNEPKD